jgi:hypothetical protein
VTLDDVARSATEQLRTAVTTGLDESEMLRRMHRARRRRATANFAVVAAAAVVVIAGAGAVLLGDEGGNTRVVSTPALTTACDQPRVTCLAGRRVRVDLRIPLEVALPTHFQDDITVSGDRSVELYRNDIEHSGITVLEDAVPVRYDASRTRDPSAGTTAASMARWLADRPYLTGARLTRRTVAGRAVWQVTGTARKDASPPDKVGLNEAAVTFDVPGQVRAWVAPVLTGRYTLTDQPGGGVTVVWSWRYGLDLRDPGTDQSLVDDVLTP